MSHRTCGAIALAAIAATSAACGDNLDPAPGADEFARRAFVQRAHRALHPSSPQLTPDEVEALLVRSDEQIVAGLVAEPATQEAVFALGLDFLGVPIERVRDPDGWSPFAVEIWPAAAGARAFRAGENPVTAFKRIAAARPYGAIVPADPEGAGDFLFPDDTYPRGTGPAYRAEMYAYVIGLLDAAIAWADAAADPLDRDELCRVARTAFILVDYGFVMGGPALFQSWYPADAGDIYDNGAIQSCFYRGATPSRDEMIATTAAMKAGFVAAYARLEPLFVAWEADPDHALELADTAGLNLINYAFGSDEPEVMYDQFWVEQENSSTNFNRRRGAYVLDRFFCDDLRPVGAALPDVHGQGRHASEPACQACHFKLDPMAGFFRRHGFAGIEYDPEQLESTDGTIYFDDGAGRSYADYDAAWRAAPGSPRAYDVGYIRSSTDDTANAYGDTLADLDAIVAAAPEVDRCFVQRMFEHFNGAEQAVDPGFLDDVTEDLRTAGFERALVRIVAGETFRASERNTTRCYDVAPGAEVSQRPPCEVATLLQTYCVSCHGGGMIQGGLDLAHWRPDASGVFAFPHGDVAAAETFVRMLDRIKTSDPQRQMPLAREMPLRAREQLATWLDLQLEGVR